MAHEIGFGKLFSNKFEKSTFNKLETWYRGKGAKVLHNCALTWKSGKITETDIIMISMRGIYVIECKRWHGIITNNGARYRKHIPHQDRDDYIDDCINPFWQNHLHAKCLKELLRRQLGIDGLSIFSLVVFPEECSIEQIQPQYADEYAVRIGTDMIKTINSIERSHRTIFTRKQVNDMYDMLKPLEPTCKEDRLMNSRRIRDQRSVSFENRRLDQAQQRVC
jgi:hypothetical protein